jgi:RNA 2',3'-cyclic 3'-phosphodiesterase
VECEPGMSQIRSFIAIELPLLIKSSIEEIQNKLKSSTADVRWVRPEGIHLTLKFLGNIEEERISEISDLVTQCASDISSFPLTVRTLGAFPNEKNPKVIWVGTDDDSGSLSKLQQALENRLSHIGFKVEKRAFSPHLTLGRLKSPKGKRELITTLADHKQSECGTFEAQEVCLFKSELKPSGAIYTKLKIFPLH